MQTFVLNAQHRPAHDGTVSERRHLAFYEVLENVSHAWIQLLATTGRGDLSMGRFAIVSVTSDFAHEMFTGDLEVSTAVEKVGDSSATFITSIRQSGVYTGSVRAVIAQVNDDRTESVPLSDEQRAALVRLQ